MQDWWSHLEASMGLTDSRMDEYIVHSRSRVLALLWLARKRGVWFGAKLFARQQSTYPVFSVKRTSWSDGASSRKHGKKCVLCSTNIFYLTNEQAQHPMAFFWFFFSLSLALIEHFTHTKKKNSSYPFFLPEPQ